MRTVAVASMVASRDGEPKGSRRRAVWDACILRRAGMPVRDIAARVGMPDSTTRKKLVDMHESRREWIAYDDERYISRGKCYLFDVDEGTAFGGLDEENGGKGGRPFAYSSGLFVAAGIYREVAGNRYRHLAGLARAKAAGRFRTPAFSTFQKRINSIGIEEDDMDGLLWFGEKGKGCEVALLIMDGSSMRAMSRSEYRQAVYGNCSKSRHKILVAGDSNSKKTLCVIVTDPSVGESSAMLGRLLDGALANVSANPGMTLAEGAVAAYDGAVDAAETYEIAEGGRRPGRPRQDHILGQPRARGGAGQLGRRAGFP